MPGVDGGRTSLGARPNVMLGYLKADNPGVLELPPEGWHDTGDIVTIDAQGFVAIKGRAKRFAKIAGEMISLAAVETLAARALAGRDVGGGERSRSAQGRKARPGDAEARTPSAPTSRPSRETRGASDLMVPAEILVVDKVPVLGSGKLDYRRRQQARRRDAEGKRRGGRLKLSPVSIAAVGTACTYERLARGVSRRTDRICSRIACHLSHRGWQLAS